MKKLTTKQTVFLVLNIILAVIVIVFGVKLFKGGQRNDTVTPEGGSVSSTSKLYDKDNVKVEVIEDGLREMGTLITQEYYFTQLEEYTNTEKFWIFDSTASFTYSYDGVVAAGIDCSKITVVKDDEKKIITIKIPKAEITSVTIDNDSFKKYEEKNGLWNKVTTDKFNDSMAAFKQKAQENAVSRGLLDNADESAEKMILSFAKSVSAADDYDIVTVRE